MTNVSTNNDGQLDRQYLQAKTNFVTLHKTESGLSDTKRENGHLAARINDAVQAVLVSNTAPLSGLFWYYYMTTNEHTMQADTGRFNFNNTCIAALYDALYDYLIHDLENNL